MSTNLSLVHSKEIPFFADLDKSCRLKKWKKAPERHIPLAQELFTGNGTEIRRHPETALWQLHVLDNIDASKDRYAGFLALLYCA